MKTPKKYLAWKDGKPLIFPNQFHHKRMKSNRFKKKMTSCKNDKTQLQLTINHI